MQVFKRLESEVRSYCRSFPTVFNRSKGYQMWDKEGRAYIDFFAGAGTLNYGHNNPLLKEKLVEYIARDGITHSLDMHTAAKANFLATFEELILKPRRFQYKVMFPGPTGTNAVESALKLVRKVTGRETVVSFTNGFHGMTLGALAMTGNTFKRRGAGVPLNHGVQMPYDHYMDDQHDSLLYLERYLQDNGSGLDLPAAVIVETVQGEGGLRKASYRWLKRLAELCRTWDMLLIVDDIQAGCGRTGPFFSFEPAGIQPDLICLSKSLSGYGVPMAVTLIRPDLDIWAPGEHNGTFRGHNLAFVTAAEALVQYWQTDDLARETDRKARKVRRFLAELVAEYPTAQGELRGRGLMQGIACGVDGLAEKICAAAFERGLIMETSGPDSEVVKLLPPLIIDDAGLEQGLQILADSMAECVQGIRESEALAVR